MNTNGSSLINVSDNLPGAIHLSGHANDELYLMNKGQFINIHWRQMKHCASDRFLCWCF
jgi:hypothetical protein